MRYEKSIDKELEAAKFDSAKSLREQLLWEKVMSTSKVIKYPDKENEYSWWSYMGRAREKNVGWRIDYFTANEEFNDRLKSCIHQPNVMGSDHCPVILETKD